MRFSGNLMRWKTFTFTILPFAASSIFGRSSQGKYIHHYLLAFLQQTLSTKQFIRIDISNVNILLVVIFISILFLPLRHGSSDANIHSTHTWMPGWDWYNFIEFEHSITAFLYTQAHVHNSFRNFVDYF